jgi:hypothetical protein
MAAITTDEFETFRRVWPKRCSCGKEYHEAGFNALPFVGTLNDDDGIPPLEHRNCTCGSTMVVPVVDIRNMYVEVRKGSHVSYQRA